MLIDDFLSAPRHITEPYLPDVLARVRGLSPRARRLAFSDDAAALMGRFVGDQPSLLIRHRQFAAAPYDVTYIEVDLRHFLRGINRASTADVREAVPDERIGYLLAGTEVYCFALPPAGSGDSAPTLAPFAVVRGEPGGTMPMPRTGRLTLIAKDERPPADAKERENRLGYRWDTEQERNRQFALGYLLGSTAVCDEAQNAAEDITASNGFAMLLRPELYADVSRDRMAEILRGQSGELRNVWTFLLFLARTSLIRLSPMPAGRRIVRGKLRAYAAHNVVTIDLGSARSVTRAFLLAGPRATPRRHEVRGHWVNWHKPPARCDHAWPLTPNGDAVFICSRCGQHRRWRKNFLRGDATKGFVSKEYAVDA